jgi:DNA-binding NarL/FixJ family response regulator
VGRTVVVVDDDASFRALAARLLQSWGYGVIGEASSVAEAATLVARVRPDVALVDVTLPDGSGFDLAAALVVGRTPVVLISADSDPSFTRAAERAGARGFVPKDELSSDTLDQLLIAS